MDGPAGMHSMSVAGRMALHPALMAVAISVVMAGARNACMRPSRQEKARTIAPQTIPTPRCMASPLKAFRPTQACTRVGGCSRQACLRRFLTG